MAPSALSVVERSVAQDQGSWVVTYRLRYHGASATVAPSDITGRVEGWVSNSRVCVHAMPKWSEVFVSGTSGLTGMADVVTSADEGNRCRERLSVQVWADDPTTPEANKSVPPALNLVPGATFRAKLRLDHVHFLYGDYDPLLGTRAFELNIGAATLHDDLPVNREHYLAQAKATWPEPNKDRCDDRLFFSGPDSLHLEAHIPGNMYYRFPERPVRYGTKMRLSYWYYIAKGTEGDCKAKLSQYKDTPTAWKILSDGVYEECLTKVGRWTKVERIFRTECDATTLALDFKIISSTDVGEMWIDDVRLEPVRGGCASRP